MSRVKDSQKLTGVQLSVIPLEATVPILSCQGYTASASKDTLPITWRNTHTHTNLITHSVQGLAHTWLHNFTRALKHTSNTLIDSPHKQTLARTYLQSYMSPEGLSLWRTQGRSGAKDGWRQQLLVPRCRCVPGANPLISALLCSAHPPAATQGLHTHYPGVS